MSEILTRTQPRTAEGISNVNLELLERLIPVVPGVTPRAGSEVSLAVPGLPERTNETQWRSLLENPRDANRRRLMAEYLRALLRVNANAEASEQDPTAAVNARGQACRVAQELAWTSLLAANRDREESVRYCSLFFSNMGQSRAQYRGKIVVLDITAEELASVHGLERLTELLGSRVNFPDGRNSFGYVVARGATSTPAALDALGKRVSDARAVLVTDAPVYRNVVELERASREGGFLEQFAGEAPHHRHMIVMANRGRVRSAFKGQHHSETEDVYSEASGPWFGHYLDNIMSGKPWKPHVGYSAGISGFDAVELPLCLRGEKSFALFAKHRLNVLMPLSAGSEVIVVWGADTLSKVDRGIQMGVGVVEMLLVRYAEYVVNKEGILNDLEEGEERLAKKLGEFMALNSGAGKMFRSGSRALVKVDYTRRAYNVSFEVVFRMVAERAYIRIAGNDEGATELEARRN